MPPPPELLNGLGEIGSPEVDRQTDAQHLPGPNGHGRVSGKVAVDLQGVDRRGKHQANARKTGISAVDAVHQHRRPVRNHQLQKIAPGHGAKPISQVLEAGLFRLPVLGEQFPAPANGAGEQLGEEADKKGEVHKIGLCLVFALVDIYEIARRLEGEEGDAHGQHPAEPGQRPGNQLLQGIQKEVRVLEHRQNSQHGDKACPKGPFSLFQQPAGNVCHRRAAQKQQAIPAAPAAIEEVAGQKQQGVSPLHRQHPHQDQHQGEEEKKGIGTE